MHGIDANPENAQPYKGEEWQEQRDCVPLTPPHRQADDQETKQPREILFFSQDL